MSAHTRDAAFVAAALTRDAVEVHYQPIVMLPGRQVIGFEALARIRDVDGTLVPPGDFIPVAEDSGQVGALGLSVLRQAVAAAARWRSRGSSLATATVSVNVAPAQLERPAVLEEVLAVLHQHGLPGAALVLEVTESTAASPAIRSAIERLSAHGIRVAIDDFGTGFATLDTLRRIPAHILKLDATFVGGVTSNGADRAIVRVVVDLADSLGMSVVAEGVETEEQAAALLRLGCSAMQGHHFARPGPDPGVAAAEAAAGGVAPGAAAPVMEGRERWAVELDESVLSAARLLASGDEACRGAVHAVTVALARAADLDPRTVRAAGRLALVHDLHRLRVDGRLPPALDRDDRLRLLADELEPTHDGGRVEVRLVRAAVSVVRLLADAGPDRLPDDLVAALHAEAAAREAADPELGALLTAVAQAPPEVVPFAELLEDLDRRRMGRRGMEERLRSVFGITKVLAGSRDTGELMRVALEEARRIVGAASASVERWERDTDSLRCLVSVGHLGPGESTFPQDEVYSLADYAQARRTMRTGLPYIHRVDDPTVDDDAVAVLTDLGKYSSAAVPVYVDGRIWGQLWFATDHGEPPFEARDTETLTGVATLMGGVVAQAENLREVDRMAFEDALTGVGNRRLIEDVLDRMSGNGEEVTVVLSDIDRLKEINDTHGHGAGDVAIRQVADCLSGAVLRWPGAVIGRLGGDEFCVVLPGGTPTQARTTVRTALDALAEGGGPSASMGVSARIPSWTLREVMASADEDLYRSKRLAHAAAGHPDRRHPVGDRRAHHPGARSAPPHGVGH